MPREEEETTWSERRELHQEDLKGSTSSGMTTHVKSGESRGMATCRDVILTDVMVLTLFLRMRPAEKEEARRRALEGLSGVNALLKKFSEDEDLRDDLKHPATRVVRMEF